MSTMKKVATGIANFAAGVYSQADDKAAQKLTKMAAKTMHSVSDISMDNATKIASNAVNNLNKSGAYKAGIAASKAAPFKGIMDSAREYYGHANSGSKIGIKQAAILGHTKDINGQRVADYKKIAGTAATIGVAGRVASGGGLYRDRYGNVNVPGLPFI